jgi:methyltransferase (TIGR00027 family)
LREGHASRTAEQNALLRALEASLPERERLFEDPLAPAFLTWPLSLVPPLATVPGLGRLVRGYVDRRWPGVRTSIAARTRLIDDTITASLKDGMPLVILGAGFDSRPYRLPALRTATVFEVDHPDTQAAKRAVLDKALPEPPRHVRFAPCDFQRDALERAMTQAGFSRATPAFLLWEGVTNYLTEAAVDATLRWCARAAPGSLLLFTYVHRDILTRPDRFAGTKQLFASLAKAGERFTWGIEPEKMPGFLTERGLSLESDVGAAEYRARYFGEAARRMRGHEFYRIARARVGRR